MQLSQILSLDCTQSAVPCSSKKRLLETISNIASPKLNIDSQIIFESLLAREKMGSTGIGAGIAIPHGRIDSQSKATAILLTTQSAIDFDALDNQPIDIVFALLVPEDQCKQHIETLSEVSKRLAKPEVCKAMRKAESNEALYQALMG